MAERPAGYCESVRGTVWSLAETLVTTRLSHKRVLTALPHREPILKWPSFILVIVVILFLKVHEVDEEESSDHVRLLFHIQVHGEGDAEVISSCEVFPDEAGPLLADLTDLMRHIRREYLELLILCTARSLAYAHRTLNQKHYVVTCIQNPVLGSQTTRRLFDGADDVSRGRLDGHDHSAAVRAGAPVAPGAALELSVYSDHFLASVIGDMHNETSTRTAALSVTCVRLLSSKVYLLAHRVLNGVSVRRLPVHKNFEQLNLLMDEKLVDLSEVL